MNLLILTNNPNRASFRQRIAIYQNFLQANGINCDAVHIPSGSLARQRLFKQAAKYDGVFLHKKGLNFIDAFFLSRYSKKVSQLIENPQLRRQMGNKGLDHVQNFDTSIIGKKLLELIKK